MGYWQPLEPAGPPGFPGSPSWSCLPRPSSVPTYPALGTPRVCRGPSGCGAAGFGVQPSRGRASLAPLPLPAAVSLGAAQDRAQSRPCALSSAAQGKKTFLGYTLCPGKRPEAAGSRHRSEAGAGLQPPLPQPWGARWDLGLGAHGGSTGTGRVAEVAQGSRSPREGRSSG